jgi:hypothetical protein
MNPGVLIIVIGFLAVGCMLGWHAQRARSAHGDVRVTKNRLPGFRKTRMRSGLYVLTLLVLSVLIMSALVHK